jgi:hypothetical protein
MRDVVQLQHLGGQTENTKKWRRGKAPKDEVRAGAVDRLRTKLLAEHVPIVTVEPVFEAPPAPVAVQPEPIKVLVEVTVEAAPEPTFPDELLTPPAPVEEAPQPELPLEAPEEVVKPKKKKKTPEEGEAVEPIVLELADKAENT